MATEKQWIVRYKHYVSNDLKLKHVNQVKALTADTMVAFDAKIDENTDFSIGNEVKGYLAKFDDVTRVQLEALPEAYEIEPIQYYKTLDVNQENAPWGLARLSSTGPVTGPNPVYTYRAEASGAGVTVYIIDTGINEKHVEFENRARKGPNFIEDSNGLISSNNDIIGHGTHVAGTIGGKEYGVAKSVNLVGIKVFNDHTGTATTIDIIRALEWVVNQVPTNGSPKAVVNLSLGGGSSPAMDAAVAATVRKGIVVVVAAGNDGVDADTTSPAREPLAITVGAIDNKDMRASFSNYGRKIDIFAPGVNILSAWIAKPGETPTNKENKEIQGTSMAAPHVAGVAVSVLSDKNQKGIINPQDVIGAILINADKGGVGNIPSPARFTTIAAIAKV